MFFIHVVECFGGVAQVTQQRVPRNTHQARVLALDEGVVQAAVRQLHDDDQLAVDILNSVQAKYEGMTDFLDPLKGLQFLLGMDGIDVERFEIAVNELDCLEKPARRLALPDLAEAAAPQRFQQPIAGNGFCIKLAQATHRSYPRRAYSQCKTRALTAGPSQTGKGAVLPSLKGCLCKGRS